MNTKMKKENGLEFHGKDYQFKDRKARYWKVNLSVEKLPGLQEFVKEIKTQPRKGTFVIVYPLDWMKPDADLHCVYAEDFDDNTGRINSINSDAINDPKPKIPSWTPGLIYYKVSAIANEMKGNSYTTELMEVCGGASSFGEGTTSTESTSLTPVSQNSIAKMWDLGSNIFMKVHFPFEGKVLIAIDIRRYYFDKNYERKHGNEGISLNPSQYRALKSFLGEISDIFGKRGTHENGKDWNLGLGKTVQVKKFKNQMKNSISFKGKHKRGISLKLEQFENLKSIIPEVDIELKIKEDSLSISETT